MGQKSRIIKTILDIFEFYLSYCSRDWAWNCSTIQWTIILQKSTDRIINFQSSNSHTSPLFKQNFILYIHHKIFLENILFTSTSLELYYKSLMKLKQFVSNFYLKSYINITDRAKVYMTLVILNKNI